MAAAGVAIAAANAPVVAGPTLQTGRTRKEAPNKYGCVVQKSESDAEQRAVDAAADKEQQDKENKDSAFWGKVGAAAANPNPNPNVYLEP